ncbi:MAG: hypothetical protein WD749_14655 [Phycisphaerales bacterium]
MSKPFLKTLLLALALLAGVLATAGHARADKLHLKDGRVLDGTVVREVEGYVWFEIKVGGIENTQVYPPADIAKVERSTPAADAAAPATTARAEKAAPRARGTGAPRAAVISLGESGDKDMVGIFMTADSLKRCIPHLEAEGVEIVAFRINSGGGALLEIQKLSDTIEYDFKPKFRVVGWIEHAISAAAMTAHCMEEIYMMPGASYGACTGWYGQLTAVKGRQLEEVLFMMEKISARGKHDPKIMRAMQIMDPLSCTINENGDVTWYQNAEGQHVVNPKERVLTFNSIDATKYKFAKGIASTVEELGKAMGYTEVEWVGKRVPGIPYPVSRAEAEMRRFRQQSFDDQSRLNQYAIEYRGSIQLAQQTPVEERGKFVNKARQALDKIKRMVKNNPNWALFVFNMLPEKFPDWVDEQEELLRNLMKR